jgi:chromatin segregation and condensation protein Rec8/ScpA/Scc1 (kleisin family)
MTLVRLADARGRGMPGRDGFLYRLKDLVERGRLDVAQLRLTEVFRWVLTLGRESLRLPTSELCSLIEAAAALALAKARRLSGYLEPIELEEPSIWLGPPAELPLRRSWIGARIGAGQWSFLSPPRTYEGEAPQLAPIAPAALRAAMAAALGRARPAPTPPVQLRLRLSVETACAHIENGLAERAEVYLHELADESRDSQVAYFLACLTLCRQGKVSLLQAEPFGSIAIRPLEEEAVDATA